MNVLFRVAHDMDRWGREETARVRKAMEGALYSASYYLFRTARYDVKTGGLGLAERVPRLLGKRARDRSVNPLTSLFKGMSYRVDKGSLTARVGFLASESGYGGVSAVMERLAARHQGGYLWRYTERDVKRLHQEGIHLRKATIERGATVPARDIMSAVEAKHAATVLQKVRDGFQAKMRGERID